MAQDNNQRHWWAIGLGTFALVVGVWFVTPKLRGAETDNAPSITPSMRVKTSPSGISHQVKPARRLVHLNTATTRQLRELPGVGELVAQRIIAARPFHSVDELAEIKGITPQQMEALRPLVTL